MTTQPPTSPEPPSGGHDGTEGQAPPPYQPYQPPAGQAPHPQAGPKRLTRSRSDKMLTGVCGGLAAYTNLDPTLVRLLTVLLVVVTFPVGLVAYIVAAVVMPQD